MVKFIKVKPIEFDETVHLNVNYISQVNRFNGDTYIILNDHDEWRIVEESVEEVMNLIEGQ